MLRINLLPEHKRIPEGTPLPIFMAIIGGIVVFAIALLANLWLWMQIGSQNEQITNLEDQIKHLQTFADKHKALENQKKELSERKDVLGQVANRQFMWSEAFDYVWTILDEHRAIWIDGIKLEKSNARAARGQKGPMKTHTLTLGCFSVGENFENANEFKKDLARKPAKDEKNTMSFFSGSEPLEFAAIPLKDGVWEEDFAFSFDVQLFVESEPPKPKKPPAPPQRRSR
jgi:Tfp pilus assembly protein PilN